MNSFNIDSVRKIYFMCATEYHILISFILATMVFPEAEKHLLISTDARTQRYLINTRKLNIWQSVTGVGGLDIDDSFCAFDAESLAIQFTFGAASFNRLVASCIEQKGIAHLADEGLLTYAAETSLRNWLAVDPQREERLAGFDLNKFSGHWLMQPSAMLEDGGRPVYTIPLKAFRERLSSDSALRSDLARLFFLEEPIPANDYEVVYFQSYLAAAGLSTAQADHLLDEVITHTIAPVRHLIKRHPGNASVDHQFKANQGDAPWEVRLLLEEALHGSDLKPIRVYLSVISSALHNSMLFDRSAHYVYLYRILWAMNGRDASHLDQQIKAFARANPTAKIHLPRNWDELTNCLSIIRKQSGLAFHLGAIPFATADGIRKTPSAGTASVAMRKLIQAEKQKLWKDVERMAIDMLNKQPGHTEAAYRLGLALKATGRGQQALHLFSQIVQNHPDHFSSLREMIDIAFEQKRYEWVLAQGWRLLGIMPQDISLRRQMAVALYQLGQEKEAFLLNESIHRLEGDKIDLLNVLAGISAEKNIFCSRGRIYADRSISLSPNDPLAELRLGIIEMNLQNFSAAERCFIMASQKAVLARLLDAENALAHSQIMQGKWDEAEQTLLRVFEARPEIKPAAVAYMMLIQRNNQYERRIAALPTATQGMVKDALAQHPGMPYALWIERVEQTTLPRQDELHDALARMRNMPKMPQFSIVMPVYNTPEIYLRACIDSVLAQSYPHWELCIADDKSPKEHVRQILREYEQKDARIRVVYRQENGHISRASNSALDIASGEYVALLYHDDALPEHALYFMALAIQEHPDAQILYSDEDKLDAKGRRFDPHFKSDWNPDLFFSQNCVSHLGVYRRDLLQRIGGFRTGVEGSQDQDLLLRCLPHVRNDQIIHIPRVLYHWRTAEGSTALASSEKSYTTEAGIKALKDYFAENGPHGIEIEAGLVPNTYRVLWPVPEPAPLVSLLIPTRDKKTITEVAVRSILDKTTYPNYEIIILDNGSVEEETLTWFEAIQREDARVRVIRYDHPFNYSAINNFGVRQAQGSLIGLINNDVEVISPDWLTEMVRHASREEIGCVGAKLYYSNDTVQHAGVIVGLRGGADHAFKHFHRDHSGYMGRLKLVQTVSAVTAACLVVRKEIYLSLGGLNETDLKVAFNDVDFCLKVQQAGYRNLWTPYAELYHHESLSRGYEDTPEKQARFQSEADYLQRTWATRHYVDPYYNQNLTRQTNNYALASLPETKRQSFGKYINYPVLEPKYISRHSDMFQVEKAVRVIAFYLPQFHTIPENDRWWGKGFTEWANVKPAKPQFEGHYQPHVPDDFLGYYNLLDRNTQVKQIELAKQYGIEGFCFYLYWFSGKRLLEQPLDNYLNDPSLDLPFCVCWANENWTRRWDGADSEILIAQQYSAQDDIDFITNCAKYLQDPRYIRIMGKPLLLVYRPSLFPDIKATVKRWRDWCQANGVGEIYLAYPQSFEFTDPAVYDFDAAIEFPPNNSSPPNITNSVKPTVDNFDCTIYDWRILLEYSEHYTNSAYKRFRGVNPSWDNTARRNNKGTIFYNSCPALFEQWLISAFTDTLNRFDNKDEQIVFINAWNEWAEGAHLEPDQRYGYAWLQAVRDAHQKTLLKT